MKLTNDKIVKIVSFGFLGLIIIFIIGAATIVFMPFALLYSVVYLIVLLYMLVLHIKNRPQEVKQSLIELADFFSSPEVVQYSVQRHRKKVLAKKRKKQIRKRKRQARRLVVIHTASRSLREFVK